MEIKESKKYLLPIEDLSSYFVVADFDRTLTTGNSKTSWSILSSSDLVPEVYKKERDDLYNIYRPIEIDEDMDPIERSEKVKEWYKRHIELFVKYQLKEELFERAAMDLRVLEFRPYAKEFIEFLHKNDIPLIIISAGIGNFIESFLKKNGCYYDNIYVSSNIITFTDGVATGVKDNIIHSLNKNEVSLTMEIKAKIKDKRNVLLLGDQKGDLLMVDPKKHENVLSVAFLTDDTQEQKEIYKTAFDIVIDNNEDYKDLMNLIFGKKE